MLLIRLAKILVTGNFKPIPYSIRIGVTGHRRLDDPIAMQAAVRRAIDSEVGKLFSTKSKANVSISYRVLSALAEGADRIAARAVLEYPDARLDVVLPLTVEDYLEDFRTEESRLEFAELLGKCRHPVQLRSRRIREDRHDAGDQAELRRESYRRVGEYLVDHCDVLIAVWDGQPARGQGGTGAVVQYAGEQDRPVIRVWGETITVYNPGVDAAAPDAIDRFNRQAITPERRADYAKNLEEELFVKPPSAASLPAGVREMVRSNFLPYYVQASIAAKTNQNRFYRWGKYVYAFSAAAVGSAAIGVLIPSLAWLGFGFELVLLSAIAMTLWRGRRTQPHQNWIENRFLTERIRCGIFMAICGVQPKPLEVLPFMGHSQSANDWMVRVFDEIWDRLPEVPGSGQGDWQLLKKYVEEAWIGDQVRFHREKSAKEKRALRILTRAGEIVLPATMVAAALHLALLWQVGGAGESAVGLGDWLHRGLSFVALLFPAIAASMAGMAAHREYRRLERRSENMAGELARLGKKMTSAEDRARFEELLQKVDAVLLQETQDWLMLMRYVEIKG